MTIHPSPAHFFSLPEASELGLRRLSGAGIDWFLHASGIPCSIQTDSLTLNRGWIPPGERGWFRLDLRMHSADTAGTRVADLLDPSCQTGFDLPDAHTAVWCGQMEELDFQLSLQLHPSDPGWLWTVCFRNLLSQPLELCPVLGQDLGLTDTAALRNNENYICQYLDHLLVEDPSLGPVLLTRQNQETDGKHPWLAQGCVTGAVRITTDGFQFFGPESRAGHPPRFHQPSSEGTSSRVRQYEFAYAGIASHTLFLQPGETQQVRFFASFQPHHPDVSGRGDLEGLPAWIRSFPEAPAKASGKPHPFSAANTVPSLINGLDPDPFDLEQWFGSPDTWRHPERDAGGALLSFFHHANRHTVLAAKERTVERAHTHLLWGGTGPSPDPGAIGTTVTAYGVFNAQTFLASPNFGRFLTVLRDPLNLLRMSGQRIFIDSGSGWRQLGVASAFDMGPREASWMYRLPGHLLEIRVWCDRNPPAAYLNIQVLKGTALRFRVTHQLAPGGNELEEAVHLQVHPETGSVTGRPGSTSLIREALPEFAFLIAASDPAAVVDILPGTGLFPVPGAFCGVDIETHPVFDFGVALSAGIEGEETLRRSIPALRRTLHAKNHASGSFRETHAGNLRIVGDTPMLSGMDEVIPWFAHDAWIHYAAPHGVEQYNGGAWGVRDVCQGSVEWLLATGQNDEVRELLRKVFAQQYRTAPLWPQWFMLEPFTHIQQAEAHGDIPFWPLKALCDYLEASGDYDFLEDPIAYTDPESFDVSGPPETIARHVDRIIEHLDERCIPGTALVNYGDGDWDDTLQPANPELRASLVSTWTVALTYHVLRLYRDVCLHAGRENKRNELTHWLERIAADFRRYLMPDGITCGFALVESDGGFRPLLHPRDQETGIRYRLLPMVRGILSGLFTPEEIERHLNLIETHLLFPDGVRLMSDPVPYRGGLSTRFKRAETASFFGREIGLQYVHAHIRYAEALVCGHRGEQAWQALAMVNPVMTCDVVPNARPRQRNQYFSSSDARFDDRYQANRDFQRLRDGSVEVDGGWRVYSSGPGIYLRTLVQDLLGFREHHGTLIFAPHLPNGTRRMRFQVPWRCQLLHVDLRCDQPSACCSELRLNGVLLSTVHGQSDPSFTHKIDVTRFQRRECDTSLKIELIFY